MAEHDLIIRGGSVVDGTGAAARTADVAVSDGIVTAVGKVDGTGRQELDADGLLVTPGFVDIHVHYDGQRSEEHTSELQSLMRTSSAVFCLNTTTPTASIHQQNTTQHT